jgi:hypothetical protein
MARRSDCSYFVVNLKAIVLVELAGKRFRWEWRRIEDLLEEAREKFKCEKA